MTTEEVDDLLSALWIHVGWGVNILEVASAMGESWVPIIHEMGGKN